MWKNISYMDAFKTVSVLLLLALPPWVVLRGYLKSSINKSKALTQLLLVLIFAVYIGGTLFTENLLPFIAVLFIFYFIFKYRDESEQIYYLRPLGNKKAEVFIYSVIFKFAITFLNLIFVLFLMGAGFKLEGQDVSKMFFNAGWLKIIILSIMTVVIAPVLEEFIFRHTLYRNLSKKFGRIAAALLTSILFAALHFNLAGTISFFGVGLYNCYLYEKYGYRAAVLNHFIFNFVSTFLIILLKVFNINIPVQ